MHVPSATVAVWLFVFSAFTATAGTNSTDSVPLAPLPLCGLCESMSRGYRSNAFMDETDRNKNTKHCTFSHYRREDANRREGRI
jgi:hypothetical protein